MKDRETPLKLVRLWSKMDPEAYDALNNCRAAKDTGEMSWPDYCVLPIGAAFTYFVTKGMEKSMAAAGAAELTACWMWRQNKIIYSFDGDLAESLAEQAEDMKDTDVLPSDLLLHLPYPIVYVKAPILEHMDGFFFWNEFDVNREAPELRVQWVFDDMEHSLPQVLHLLPGKTLKECVMDTIRTTEEHMELDIKTEEAGVEAARIILSAVQLILYLIAENADVQIVPPSPQIEWKDRKVSVIKRKDNDKEDKASSVKEFTVGIRVGAALRKVSKQSSTTGGSTTGSAKRPHSRRGHWHHYWTGPKDGDRELILKWTPPTIIHAEIGLEDKIVVFPVKQ